ncbi:MAG: hypothetical protein K5918_00095 [Bacteroidales bacterium]|nr:hypothetical protein [Bacteroidales bacterium]
MKRGGHAWPPQILIVNSELQMLHDGVGGELALVGHKVQNIDQFPSQGGLYRPFIDHFLR